MKFSCQQFLPKNNKYLYLFLREFNITLKNNNIENDNKKTQKL